MVQSQIICRMELPYQLSDSYYGDYRMLLSCTDCLDTNSNDGLMLGENGFRCKRYEWECARVSPSGEFQIVRTLDRFRLTFFRRQINEELERMRKEYEETKEIL